jgi:hypothetical protein
MYHLAALLSSKKRNNMKIIDVNGYKLGVVYWNPHEKPNWLTINDLMHQMRAPRLYDVPRTDIDRYAVLVTELRCLVEAYAQALYDYYCKNV